MARKRDHQGPGVDGPAKGSRQFRWVALCYEILLGYDYGPKVWFWRGWWSSEGFDHNRDSICQANCCGGMQQTQSYEIINGTSIRGNNGGTQIGSTGAKGTKDGRMMGVVGMSTVVGWSDEEFHDLHWMSKFEKSQTISARVEKLDGCPLLPNARRR